MRLNVDFTQENRKNLFFTSDFHLFHKNVLKFDNRPFSGVNEMHIEIEKGWNKVVKQNDIVIYLGDLSFARNEDKSSVQAMLNRLNGTIHFVMGNHDKLDDIKKISRFQSVQDYLEVRVKHVLDYNEVETLFCCMHYPIYSWNKSHHGSWLVHGHCHMNLLNEESTWFSEMNSFCDFIPSDQLEKFKLLIAQKNYYNRRVFDVGIMGHDYKPVSYLDILAMTNSKTLSKHH